MSIFTYNDIHPNIHDSAFIAEGVQIMGDVEIQANASCWYNAVLRGDIQPIRVGEGTNIQDGCVLHTSYNAPPVTVGNRVTVGHGAILHSCTIEDNALIGMGATVLDGAIVRKNAMIGANSLVPPGKEIPSGVLAVGIPAKVVRNLTPEEIEQLYQSAQNYIEEANHHKHNKKVL